MVLSPDIGPIPDGLESSHFCGNEWCVLHLGWETKSVNQDRGPCFEPTRDNLACNGHNSSPLVYCIRSRAASSLVPGLLNAQGKDTRPICEIPTVRRWWNERDSVSGRQAKELYLDVLKTGGKGGATGKQKMVAFVQRIAHVLSSPLKKKLKTEQGE